MSHEGCVIKLPGTSATVCEQRLDCAVKGGSDASIAPQLGPPVRCDAVFVHLAARSFLVPPAGVFQAAEADVLAVGGRDDSLRVHVHLSMRGSQEKWS